MEEKVRERKSEKESSILLMAELHSNLLWAIASQLLTLQQVHV